MPVVADRLLDLIEELLERGKFVVGRGYGRGEWRLGGGPSLLGGRDECEREHERTRPHQGLGLEHRSLPSSAVAFAQGAALPEPDVTVNPESVGLIVWTMSSSVVMTMMMPVIAVPMPMRPARILAEHQRLDGDGHRIGGQSDAAKIDIVEIPQHDAIDHQDSFLINNSSRMIAPRVWATSPSSIR